MIVDINANKSFSERLEEHIATDPKCLHNKALEESVSLFLLVNKVITHYS